VSVVTCAESRIESREPVGLQPPVGAIRRLVILTVIYIPA
jgi:hypothetical protein